MSSKRLWRGFSAYLLVAVIMIVVIGVVKRNSTPFELTPAQQHWQQPKEIAEQFPQPISPTQWPLNFSPIEKLTAQAPLTEHRTLAINEQTRALLASIIKAFPYQTTDPLLTRIQFLIRQQWPAPIGEPLASLVAGYFYYSQALDDATRTNNQISGLEMAKLRLKQQLKLQKQYFDAKTAVALFQEKNHLATYLLNRKTVQENQQLSAPQKQQTLRQLHQRFLEEKQE